MQQEEPPKPKPKPKPVEPEPLPPEPQRIVVEAPVVMAEEPNTLEAPGYGVMHANVHHAFTFASGPIRFVKAYAQVDNIFNRNYVSSAGVVADTPGVPDSAKQSFFAGYGRSVYGGVTGGF